eukprot:1185576-Prorocentrum_minimum.AAC.1
MGVSDRKDREGLQRDLVWTWAKHAATIIAQFRKIQRRKPARKRELVEVTPTYMAAGFPGNPSCPSGRPDHPPVRAG